MVKPLLLPFCQFAMYSRNDDTLAPVELILWPGQGNQGDWHEQDDQGEVYVAANLECQLV